MARILIIEDDRPINELIKRTLAGAGYECMQSYSGIQGLNILKDNKFDIVLLDVNLPDIDGFSLCSHIEDTPVIFVTARGDIDDRLRGFGRGAEDYIVKPFDLNELIARVGVVLRRYTRAGAVFKIADIEVDMSNRSVTLNKKPVMLSHQEMQLLTAFIEHKNMVLSRQQLVDLAWSEDYEGDLRTVDVHVRRLREKLNLHNYIKTVFKAGYRLEI